MCDNCENFKPRKMAYIPREDSLPLQIDKSPLWSSVHNEKYVVTQLRIPPSDMQQGDIPNKTITISDCGGRRCPYCGR
jgi:hypothetical protein